MSLFGPSRPKGITKDELSFIRGELGSAPMGHSAEKLTSTQLEDIMGDLSLSVDADTAQDISHHWEQVSASEAEQIEKSASENKKIKYSSVQLEHIKRVLDKYIAIDKHKSFL